MSQRCCPAAVAAFSGGPSYGMNGTGKSTIAKAIRLSAAEGDLSSLKTFGENLPPACQCLPPIPKVLVFDEDFVSTIVFRESEVIQNAFEVFIKTSQYEEKQRLIKVAPLRVV